MNKRVKHGHMPTLLAALDLLANAHTRDDWRVGFVVETTPALFPGSEIERSQYLDAWRVVREALGYETAPACAR